MKRKTTAKRLIFRGEPSPARAGLNVENPGPSGNRSMFAPAEFYCIVLEVKKVGIRAAFLF